MDNDNEKIPIKLAELSIKKFNDIAVPNCLGLLKNHKSNIEKSVALGDWDKIKKEEINATRIIKQLKNILIEMNSLRNRIQPSDVNKFDQIVNKSREKSLAAIREYLDLQLKTPDKSLSRATTFDDDIIEIDNSVPQIQTNFQMDEYQLKSQQACLVEFENLQREVEELYSLFSKLNENVVEQKEMVEVVADNVEETVVNVEKGESNLRTALRYKKTMYPICGALLGTCIGGPVGFFVGLKAGGLAAVGCGILGFTGGAVLKKHEETGVHQSHEAVPTSEKQD